MRSRNLVWTEQIDLGSAEMLQESRRHLEFLRGQMRATSHAIDTARVCIDESWEMLAQFPPPPAGSPAIRRRIDNPA